MLATTIVAHKHCALSGRLQALYQLAVTDILDEFQRTGGTVRQAHPRETCLKAHVLLGRGGMNNMHAFPSCFQSILEDVLCSELRAAGCTNVCKVALTAAAAAADEFDALDVYYGRKLHGSCKRAYDDAYAATRAGKADAWIEYGDAVCAFMADAVGVCKNALGARSDKTRTLLAEHRRCVGVRKRHCAACVHCCCNK